MNTTRELTVLDNAQVKLRITVPGDEVQKEYDGIVREYCANARIPGFRKGKVPSEVMIRKLGSSLIDQTRVQVLEKAVEEAFAAAERKPLPYGNPAVKADETLAPGRDWSFEVTYDTWPEISLGPYTGIAVEQPAWEIDAEDIGRELKGVQEQNALFVDKEEGIVAAGDIVNLDYVELEVGSPKPATKREAFVFEVGTGYNYYRLDEEIVGMKKGETRDLTKVYPADAENKDLAGRTVSLRVTVNAVKEKKLPEINDELAQDISEKFKTLEDLKADVRARLGAAVQSRLRAQALNAILDRVVAASTIALPRSLVEYQLDGMWHDYVAQTRLDEKRLVRLLAEQGRDPAGMREEWRSAAEGRAKLQLVISEIAKREHIAIEEAELEAEIARLAANRQVQPAELKESLAKNDLIGSLASSLRLEKLYDFLLSKAVLTSGAPKKVLDILSGA